MLEGLHEETLGMVEFHEVCRTLLEVLYEETLGIVEFHETGKNFLEVLDRVLIVVVLYEYFTHRFEVIFYILYLCIK